MVQATDYVGKPRITGGDEFVGRMVSFDNPSLRGILLSHRLALSFIILTALLLFHTIMPLIHMTNFMAVDVYVKNDKNSPGHYDVFFSCFQAGRYELSLTHEDMHVKGSPFTVEAVL